MKKNRINIAGMCFLIPSLGYFICAVPGFINKENRAVTYLCLGVCFLCLSLAYFNKGKNKK